MSFNLIVEFSLHFTSFRNIDLLQQGIYHIKTQLSLHPRSSLFLPVVAPPSANPRTSSHHGVTDPTEPQSPPAVLASSSLSKGEADASPKSSRSPALVAPSAVRATKSDGDDSGPGGSSPAHRGYSSPHASGGAAESRGGGGVYLRRLLRGHANCSLAAIPYTHFSSPLQLFEGDANRDKYGFSGPSVNGEYKQNPPWMNALRSAEQQLHWAYFSNQNLEDVTWITKALSQSAGGPGLVLLNQQLRAAETGDRESSSTLNGGRAGGVHSTRGTARHSRRGGGGGGDNKNSHALLPSHIDDKEYTFSTKGFLIRYCDEHVSLQPTLAWAKALHSRRPLSVLFCDQHALKSSGRVHPPLRKKRIGPQERRTRAGQARLLAMENLSRSLVFFVGLLTLDTACAERPRQRHSMCSGEVLLIFEVRGRMHLRSL